MSSISAIMMLKVILYWGKRKLNSELWTLHRTQYRGNVKDAHNIISMIIDGEGYLHISFDHHGHKLNYCRSIAPASWNWERKCQ